jgi:hypothetical protein
MQFMSRRARIARLLATNIEVHAVDPLNRQLRMTLEDLGNAMCYHPPGSGRQVLPLVGV